MPPCGRRRPSCPGPWFSSSLPGGGRSAPGGKFGPDNLDLECKAGLQKILKPSHYGAIEGWMRSHGTKDKRGIVLLTEAAVGDNGVPVQQDKAYQALQQPVQQNPKGRHRVNGLGPTMHVSADRQQVDLQRVRCHDDQADKDKVRRRKFLNDFVPVPSTDSVSEFYRLSDVPVASEPGAKVLSEDARRGLTRWQIRGPERNREEAAQICQALRSLQGAVDACPTYNDALRARKSGGEGAADCLVDHSYVKRAFRDGNYARTLPMNKGLSRSVPSLAPSYMTLDQLESVKRPGGYAVHHNDVEPLAYKKNRQRGGVSKMVHGGSTSYATSYDAMCAYPAAA